METTGLNATELGGYCRETELYHEQVARWRKAVQDDKRDIKRLQLELRRMDKAPLLIPWKVPVDNVLAIAEERLDFVMDRLQKNTA